MNNISDKIFKLHNGLHLPSTHREISNKLFDPLDSLLSDLDDAILLDLNWCYYAAY